MLHWFADKALKTVVAVVTFYGVMIVGSVFGGSYDSDAERSWRQMDKDMQRDSETREAFGPMVETQNKTHFTVGTRRVECWGPGDYRVVCATCGGQKSGPYPERKDATNEAINTSDQPCECGAE